MQLYGFWRSSATFRVRVALALKGIEVSQTAVNLEEGEQHDPAFLAINPQAALPALVIPGLGVLTQSSAILEYLEETQPTPALLPADPFGRARVRSLAGLMASDTHPLVVPRVRKYLTGPGGNLDLTAWRGWQVTWLTRGFQAMEARLAGDPATGVFCHGDTVGMADICLASVMAIARVFKIEVADIPTVDRIMARCDALDAFKQADPFKQVGAPATA
jgi:maleylacetoacetate isomerase